MSVVMYKDGESLRVDPEQIQEHKKQGWSLNDSTTKKREEKPEEEAEESEQKARPAGRPAGPVSNPNLRKMARDAGLKNWRTATIKTLKRGLGWYE